MIATDIFDPEGGHEKAWKRVSPSVQIAIQGQQMLIQREISDRNGDRYIPTSGWRSDSGNRRAGGVADSRHLWGAARDFISSDPDYRLPPLVDPRRFLVLRSPAIGPFRCWHVEVI